MKPWGLGILAGVCVAVVCASAWSQSIILIEPKHFVIAEIRGYTVTFSEYLGTIGDGRKWIKKRIAELQAEGLQAQRANKALKKELSALKRKLGGLKRVLAREEDEALLLLRRRAVSCPCTVSGACR